MKWLVQYGAVGAAGCLGAMARLAVGTLCGRWFGTDFPIGTLVINISGSFILGWFLAMCGTRVVSDTLRVAIAVGFVGAYTTFSTFMFESAKLMNDGAWWKVTANLAGSLVLGLIAVRLGMYAGGR